jgi:putative PIN family toxin of toxin-antitoxin system
VKVLLDANVLIAASATQGICHLIVEMCLAEHDLVVSEPLLQEVRDKLKKRLHLPPKDIHDALDLFRRSGDIVTPAAVDKDQCRDPKDLHVLGAALAGECDLIVSGDKDLLALGSFQRIRIVTPRDFLDQSREP